MSPDRPPPEKPEDAAARAELRCRAILDGLSDPLLSVDEDLLIRYANAAVTRVLGHGPGAIVARPLDVLLDREERERVSLQLERAMAGPRDPLPVEHRVQRADGKWEVVETTPNVFADPTGRPFLVLHLRCVTERRRLEAELSQQLKMETLGRLAGGIAHDFNNLLTVILSGTEELREAASAGASPRSEVIDDVQAATQRAAELTRQLLAFARKQVIQPVALDLGELVQRSAKLLQRVLSEGIALVTWVEPGLWRVRGDPGQLEQVILNLALNARDAMPDGGELRVETGNVQLGAEERARHPDLREGAYVWLRVSDTGTGMTPEVKAHVFEPFFTTKPPGKGTGLGLATVYGVVKQSEGHLRLDSVVGRGTTFELYFPRTREAAGGETLVGARARRGTETVLVVEDDPGVRGVTARTLRSGGYRVLEAANAADALGIVGRQGEAIHLMVTDVIMPGENGRWLAEEARRRRPTLRVLFVSGHGGDVIARAGASEAELPVLAKPFTAAALLGRVRAVLDAA